MTIITTLNYPIALWWNDCPRTAGLNAIDQIVGIVALVGQYRVSSKAFQQRFGLRNIGHLTPRQQPAHRITERIDNRVNLTCPSTTRAIYRLTIFFFGAPAACGWARTAVLSIISISKSRSPLTASIKRCHTPDSPQRLHRVYVVCQLPNSPGRSRHGDPVRTIQSTASKNNRLSCAVASGSPGLPGNNRDNFFHCSLRSHFLPSFIFATRLFKYRM